MSSDIQKIKKLSADLVAKSKGTMIAPREIIEKIERLAPEAVTTLEDLMRSSKADSVRLRAALELLGLAGISKETKISVKAEVEDMDESAINSRLTELLTKAQGVVLEGEFKDITPETIEDEDECQKA